MQLISKENPQSKLKISKKKMIKTFQNVCDACINIWAFLFVFVLVPGRLSQSQLT